jgi:two-component system chemotaxis response regulator CheY
MRALLIDDSRVTRMVLGRIVKDLGFEVAEAEDGRQGLEELRQQAPIAVALIDGHMPGMDGWEVMRAVRADPAFSGVRMLLISGEQKQEEFQRALDAGADGYLVKPFTRDGLAEEFRRIGLRTGDV